MEKTRYVNLPIIGRVQHGERTEKKVAELGYFIAKIQDEYMQKYLEKFDKLYKGQKSLDIELFSEEPLSIKYVRYNQSGEVCRCLEESDLATQKGKKGWQQIQCAGPDCQYRQRNELGKCACNRIGWLKFIIPSICKDRIFLMKITGQTSLNRLDDYFYLQKVQGKSIKGQYTLFLKKEEQSNSLGQTFSNYILDILKKDESDLIEPISQMNEEPKELYKVNDKEINSNVDEPQKNITEVPGKDTNIQDKKSNEKYDTAKENVKKESKKKTKKTEEKLKEKNDESEQQNKMSEFSNYYILESTFKENINNKGQVKEYLIGKFYDMEDKVQNIVIKPDYEKELLECDIGTVVELDIKDVAERKFAVDLKFIDKRIKKVA